MNVHWGVDNRTAGLRVPISRPASRRVESRFAGSDVNPYLAIAATLACGYLGIQEKLKPTPALNGSAYDQPKSLPAAMETSLAMLEQETALQSLIGEEFVRAYVAIKRKEYETFFRVISSWEREFLLLSV